MIVQANGISVNLDAVEAIEPAESGCILRTAFNVYPCSIPFPTMSSMWATKSGAVSKNIELLTKYHQSARI